jgi:hypothetical protein
MLKSSTIAAVLTGGLPLAAIAGIFMLWDHSSGASSSPGAGLDSATTSLPRAHEADTRSVADSESAPIAAKPVPTPSLVRASTEVVVMQRDAPELLDEASLLSKLHDLGAEDPPQSLWLARQAVHRFPDSPSAPEFRWNVVKALFNQGRLDEAKNEARAMLEKHPNSSFTGDVIHHLLSPPPNPREP